MNKISHASQAGSTRFRALLSTGAALLSFFPLKSHGDILTLPHRSEVLPNGLKVFLVKYPSPGAVSYRLAVHVGSGQEVEKGKSGFAHFFEHLMFRGTKKRSGKEFGNLYVKLGCENNANTSYDVTVYEGSVAKEYLPQILEAEADRFANLYFDEKGLRDEAGAVLGEYNKDVAQPEFLLEEKLMETAFTQHPYGHTTMGYKQDVVQFTERYQDVWPFFKRYYRPSNVAIIVTGDVDFNETLDTIKKHFGTWKDPQIAPVVIPVEPEQTSARKAEVKLDKPTQARLVVAYKIPAFSTKNKDSAAVNLLGEILFSVTSDFQKEYRYNRKWLDLVYVSGNEWVAPGLWQIQVRFSQAGQGKEAEVLAAIEKTIAQARTGFVPASRIAESKKRVKSAALTQWFSSPDHLANTLAWYTTLEGDLGVLSRVVNRSDELTAEDLKSFATRYLADSQKTVVTLKGK